LIFSYLKKGSGYRYACLWILKFENLLICYLWPNSNTRWECSRLGRNEGNV